MVVRREKSSVVASFDGFPRVSDTTESTMESTALTDSGTDTETPAQSRRHTHTAIDTQVASSQHPVDAWHWSTWSVERCSASASAPPPPPPHKATRKTLMVMLAARRFGGSRACIHHETAKPEHARPPTPWPIYVQGRIASPGPARVSRPRALSVTVSPRRLMKMAPSLGVRVPRTPTPPSPRTSPKRRHRLTSRDPSVVCARFGMSAAPRRTAPRRAAPRRCVAHRWSSHALRW